MKLLFNFWVSEPARDRPPTEANLLALDIPPTEANLLALDIPRFVRMDAGLGGSAVWFIGNPPVIDGRVNKYPIVARIPDLPRRT